MSVSAFAGFLAAIGHRVVQTESAYWYDAGLRCFQSVPSHRLLTPSQTEVDTVLRGHRAFGLRFSAPLDHSGKLSYQIVCDAHDYGFEQLSANVRSKVRRGLRRCEVRPATFSEIAVLGSKADEETRQRQDRGAARRRTEWERYWHAAASTAGMEGWGAFLDGELAAYLVTVDFDDCVEFLLARSRSDLLHAYPNNALIFHVAREMLVVRGVRELTFGLESLESVESLDDFKYGMGFRPRPLRQKVVLHPYLAAALRVPPVHALVQRFAADPSGRPVFWRKAAGLIRFAEESRDGDG